MARDYIDIGSAPAEEACAQVGAPDYYETARPECIRFIDLIRRTVGVEPPKALLRVKSNPHDFGAYYSVVCYFDDDDEESTRYAYRCESEAPPRWDTALADSEQLAAARTDQVCSSCLAVAEEQGIPDRADQELLMMELGGEVEDHLCDARETPDLRLACHCACQPDRTIPA